MHAPPRFFPTALGLCWSCLAVWCPPADGKDASRLVVAVEPRPEKAPTSLPERRILQLKHTPAPPLIDGALREACWADATVTGNLSVKAGGKFEQPFPKKTTLRAIYDDTTLYLGIECFDPDIANILRTYTKRDDKYWLDDDVEFMLDANCDRRTFHQFLLNAAGGRGDYKAWLEGTRVLADPAYNPDWQLATRVTDDRWTAEIALPFKSLGIERVVPGMRWGFNFCRIENPGGILGNWTQTADHRDPRLFGDLVFGHAPYTLGETNPGRRERGTNLFRARVANHTDTAHVLTTALTVSANGDPVGHATCRRSVPAGAAEVFWLPYDLPGRATAFDLRLDLRGPGTEDILAQRTYRVEPPPPLTARMDAVEYFETDKLAKAHVRIAAGDVTLTTGALRVALFRGSTQLAADSLSPVHAGASLLHLDTARLKAGEYAVIITLVDADGMALASTRLTFSKSRSLMDF